MSATIEIEHRHDATTPTTSKRRRGGRRGNGRLLHAYTWLVIFWLCLPIIVMIVFGFNNTKGKYNFVWNGVTLRWYRHLFAIHDLTNALINSVTIALIVTAVATCLGTFVGLALGKYRFPGRGSVELLLFANIAAPEIAIGAALLSLFVSFNIPLGYWTIVIAHIMFDIAYVSVTVRARTVGYNHSLEEAAHDLGAGSWTTFRLVTLHVIAPGVVAGALLAFALSIDDFIITQFTAGQTLTFPLWVWGSSRVGTPPQVNVMGTLIFAFGLLLAITAAVINRRKKA
jgi:spermidine/putrescine transport system permease protein